jgi:hypothetical protein
MNQYVPNNRPCLPYIYCDKPHVDESLSSWLDRNIQRYGLNRHTLALVLGFSPRVGWDYDAFDFWEMRRALFGSLGISWNDVRHLATTLPEREWTVESRYRYSYCPRCFNEDLNEERTPYFRKVWSHLLLTHCEKHRTPLFPWKSHETYGTRILPTQWLKSTNFERYKPQYAAHPWVASAELAKALKLIKTFERQLEKDPHSNEVWQTLTSFESACVRYRPYRDDDGSSGPLANDMGKVCRVLTLVLERFDYRGEKRMIAKELCPRFFSSEYVGFNHLNVRHTQRSRAWPFIARSLWDISTRRAAIWCVAHTMSSLSPKTKLRTGGYSPPGHSMGWYEAMAGVIGDRDAVEAAVHTQASRHLLEPIQYSSPEGPPNHYWRSQESAVY